MASLPPAAESALQTIQANAAQEMLNNLAAAESGAPAQAPPAQAPPAQPALAPVAPAAQPVPAPEPQQAQPAPAPPKTPDQTQPAVPPPAGQPPAPITIDPNSLSPEARRYYEMQGGDINKALEHALRDNNELGKRGVREAPWEEPKTAEPPLIADPKAIEAHLTGLLDEDPIAVAKVTEYVTAAQALKELPPLNKIQADISYFGRRLQEKDILPDERDTFREQLREARELRDQRVEIQRQADEANNAYVERARFYRGRIDEALQAQQQQAETDEKIESHAQWFAEAWPQSVHRIAQKHGFTPSQSERLAQRAHQAAFVQTHFKGESVDDIDGFVDKQAVGLKAEWDEVHRELSAVYGQKAVERAAQPGPVNGTAPQTPGVATAPTEIKSLDDIYRTSTQRTQELLAGR